MFIRIYIFVSDKNQANRHTLFTPINCSCDIGHACTQTLPEFTSYVKKYTIKLSIQNGKKASETVKLETLMQSTV